MAFGYVHVRSSGLLGRVGMQSLKRVSALSLGCSIFCRDRTIQWALSGSAFPPRVTAFTALLSRTRSASLPPMGASGTNWDALQLAHNINKGTGVVVTRSAVKIGQAEEKTKGSTASAETLSAPHRPESQHKCHA